MKHFLPLWALYFSVASYAAAQDISVKYAEGISTESLRADLSYLASDELEGRETSKAGQYTAARFIAGKFKEIGLQPIVDLDGHKSYFQWFEVAAKGKRMKLLKPGEELPDGFERRASMNVLGYLEGSSKKDEVVVITAHYDHIGISADGQINNGADDDGSGTSAVIEIARAFAKAKAEGHGPARSILFMTVAGEEKGLLGSSYYTDVKPVLPLDKLVCDLNIDMIGRKDKHHDTDNYLYLIGADKISTELDEISKSTNEKYGHFALDYTYNDEKDPNRFYYRSDHYNFAKNGIPVIFYFTGVHEDYHKPGDDIDKILFPKYTRIVRLIFHTAWEVANRDKRLEKDKL
ncbi:M28 family peptidase [Marinilongibacter aquaticus]|uniref:M28 family peptidase n=1 Tax=Marinilongibacter aquaticus TaxID=2975157 RepID=UPI0021BCFD1E|nr:M28 family peptidase [Marinilongibacter aquaticus]UBM60324.1 M28 family peptidase [Marinilongibacter aquaticus]